MSLHARHYAFIALLGTNAGGAVSTMLGDPNVRSLLVSLICGLSSMLGVASWNWFQNRFGKRYPSVVADIDAVVHEFKPLVDRYGPELAAAIIARLALNTSPPLASPTDAVTAPQRVVRREGAP